MPALTCLEVLTWRDKHLASAPVAPVSQLSPGLGCCHPLPKHLGGIFMPAPPNLPTQEPSQCQGWRNSQSGACRV